MRRFASAVGATVASPMVEAMDVNAILQEIDVNEVLAQVDVNAVLDRLDVNRIFDRIDANRIFDRKSSLFWFVFCFESYRLSISIPWTCSYYLCILVLSFFFSISRLGF